MKHCFIQYSHQVLKAGERGDRGWDGWIASPTQWTRVWANSKRWWRTGKPGVLKFMGLQRVRHDWETEQQNHTLLIPELMHLIIGSLYPLTTFTHYLTPASHPWRPLICSVSMRLFLFFQIPHISESIEYLSFSVCLISLSIIPSRFIHFVTHGMYIPSKLPGEVDATGVGTTLKVLGFWAISWILCVCKYFVRRGFIVTMSLKQSWTWKISRTIALKEIKV